ncbi:ABC transporter ATP-binding protein [Candidatus Uabimicrobium amorphum]|uniref:ABC transporter n=1 Tax=Uabimicrobium amorphum TaxID=2596890 RepID=A0A5S9IV59_UABAM|nr:ABC transporter ATP-binding protein [Candidatus Uabimicrobium amorphum]BBM88101.1 ABC transporter [Candidatus Uabimicrobium amorphum]
MKIAIEVQKLHKHYESFHALKGIDLSVHHGEIFGFLGPNGAGKTTTIRCLLDLIRPSSGTVRIFDIDPQQNSVNVKKFIGYLPGELNLDDRLTARQSLSLFAALRNHQADWKWIEEHANKLKLRLDTKIKNFSKGNKQKVGIIQAFMHQPRLLILDEPTSGLDPLMQKQVLQMVTAAKNNGATVFFSSHILSEVEEVSDRVAIIRDGVIIDTAVVQNLIAKNVRCVTITCEKQIDVDGLLNKLPHLKLLENKQNTIVLQVEKELAKVIDYCSPYTIKDFVTKEPSLEEIFLTYYTS